MSTAGEKLTKDLEFVELLAAQIDAYLMSDAIFWKTTHPSLPDLTLGGYLMRQARLLALRKSLSETEQARLDTSVAQFNQAIVAKGPRFPQKAQHELEARLRQWDEYLKDVEEERGGAVNYSTAAETRTMIATLLDKLQIADYAIPSHIPDKLNTLDDKLRRQWRSGGFVWPAEWQPAYPQAMYWWLYGQPA